MIKINNVELGVLPNYEYFTKLHKDSLVSVSGEDKDFIINMVEFLPSITDKSYLGTIAGIKIYDKEN
jgi:hypothetical protein